MKVLIADSLPKDVVARFQQASFEVSSEPGLKDDALVQRLAVWTPDILVVRSTKVPKVALEAAPLSLVIRAGSGTNNVDVVTASQRGIYVANCPGKNAVAVAELAMGMIVALDRRIADCTADLRSGNWNKKRFSQANGLAGRTLGIVGLGEIGRQVAVRAQAFGMRVVAWSRSLSDQNAQSLGIERVESVVDLARESDVVSVHVALTDQTQGFIDQDFFDALRPGCLFVNTSRGGVVNKAAFADAVKNRDLRAGLDVWFDQPSSAEAAFEDDAIGLTGVMGTPHIGASTQQAQEAVADEALRIACVFRDCGRVPNCVNLQGSDTAAGADTGNQPSTVTVRHLDRVGVLAFVLDHLQGASINVRQMQNQLFQGEGAAASATIQLDRMPPEVLLAILREHEHVLDVRVSQA